MEEKKETLIGWLNDAYGMERNAEQMLEQAIRDAEDEPEVKAKLEQHLEETRSQAEGVKVCVQNLGGSPSEVKGLLGSMGGTMAGLSTGMFADEKVKNALAGYTTEHIEIASYTALITAAEELGEEEVVKVCKEILGQEETMASWFEEQLPAIVKKHMQEQ